MKLLPSTTLVLTLLSTALASEMVKDQASMLNDLNTNFQMNNKLASKLLESATMHTSSTNTDEQSQQRKLQYYDDYSIASYSIQFQGCHHIQQWNNQDYYDDDIRVKTKRLVRFRLVPYEQCHSIPPWSSVFEKAQNSLGKYQDHGEYIVDLNTFVGAYVQAKVEENEALCGDCASGCYYGGDDDASSAQYASCISECYAENGCDEDVEQVLDYSGCAAYENYADDDADDDANAKEYYFGPYCARQGGEIRMNLFSDETCSTLVQCNGGRTQGHSCYKQKYGSQLPFTKKNIVQDACYPCSSNYQDLESDEDINYNNYDFGYARDVCTNVYTPAGKCEAHMTKGTGVDNACSYISSLKIGVSSDGYAVGVKRSLGADVAIILLGGGTALMCSYIYYLKYLLSK